MKALEQLKDELKSKFNNDIIKFETPIDDRLFIDVKKEGIKGISKEIFGRGGRYLVSIGYDNIARDNTLGMVHTFAFDKESYFVCVRTSVPESDPVLDSITPDVPNAGWSEREYMDLLGMKFTGHPKPKKLVLADDWPEGIHPLRKDVPYNLMPPPAENVAYQMDECPEGCSVVPVGPFHPSLHEPNHWAIFVDGETIKGCDYRGFMTHRGIEKLCTTQISYNEVPFIAERICGICGSVHATAYSQAVEMAAGFKISRRSEFIRTIMLEIERLHSHLLWLGVAGHLIGFDTVFMQAWRIREAIMWLCERITGNRKTYGMIVIGGVRRDITPELKEDILNVMKKVDDECNVVYKAIIGDTTIHKRSKGVGYMTKEEAIQWSIVGPPARARGVDIDARRDHPYAAYDEMAFDVPVVDTNDVWGTVVVRVLEIFEAVKIIRQALELMPAGPIMTEMDEVIAPLKHAISNVEAPRGEAVHYVITGEENRADRWRVRAPTYPNLQGVPTMLLNEQFGDFPIILGSIDPCFSCTDRVQVVNIKSGKVNVMSQRDLEKMSRRA
ncbi:MAG TPA: NADH-quinone oxidoreductase subunit C [Spirochaetota bacterium]|nr:NADH-quinone oxidoreductase subunit C [Spirochaetota bacterium]HPI90061.1 NADH-quinone oxidoreductase subunit C [Spirochaetota bacterium]HPR47848.1 NADH-quinone oxidoreductase subunit C [Spirochaetota bacterium]